MSVHQWLLRDSPNSTSQAGYGLGFNGPARGLATLSIIGPLMALLFVCNRVYWRVKVLGRVWYDDWAILLSMAFLIAQSASGLAASAAGYGVASESLSPQSVQNALYYFFQLQIYYKITINLAKASIVLLYYRIFSTRLFRQICLVVLAAVIGFMIILTALTIFQCHPVQKIYNQSVQGTCRPALTLWRVNAIYNIVSDIVIILMPFPVIRSLGLPFVHFVGLAGILCCGIFVIITAILRYTTLATAGRARDPLAGTLVSTVWTQAEASVAIICACLPMLRVLLQRLFPCLRSPTRSALTPNDDAELHERITRRGSSDTADEHGQSSTVARLPAPHRLSGAMNAGKLGPGEFQAARGLVIFPRQAGHPRGELAVFATHL